MRDFFDNLSSLSWWLGVVVVGIVINIISPYIGKGIEKILIKTSANYRNKIAERSKKRKEKINELKANQHKQIMLSFKEQRLRIRSLDEFIGGVVWLVLGGIAGAIGLSVDNANARLYFLSFFGVISLYGLILCLLSANESRKAIEIRNILNEVNPDDADTDIGDWI